MKEIDFKKKVFAFFWFIAIFLLFFYSFTQIDLGLTLTRVSFWQIIQKKFQSIGYFNRPLSTYFYLGILFLLFVLYFFLLRAVKQNLFTSREIWFLILATGVILWFSYNAFSYDLFNYIFDARIVTYYRQNPYYHKALDFPGDPMLGFMHWTHRVYPYGPLWLAFTIPLSFLGFQKLIPTMILFKGLAVISFLIACLAIKKILTKINPQVKLFGLAVFAFSPLVIIEGLVSAHNDILMMALALLSFWFLIEKRILLAWLMLGLSVGIKFATLFLLPVFIGVSFRQFTRKKVNWERAILTAFFLMAIAVLVAIKRDELKPWYVLYPLSFLVLIPGKRWLFWPLTGLSLGVLLSYAPFLFLGNWNDPVPAIKTGLITGFLILGINISLFDFLKSLLKKKLKPKKAN